MPWALVCLLFSHLANAQNFSVPDGSQKDLSQTFYVGQTIPIAWVGPGNPVTWPGMNSSISDLWITWFDSNDFAQRLSCEFPNKPHPLLKGLKGRVF